MKTLPNNSLEWISSLGYFEALQYKNKFVCHELKDGILKLTFYVNPNQRTTNHLAVATKKIKSMNKVMHFAQHRAACIKIDTKVNNLITYIYQVDVEINHRLYKEELNSFKDEIIENKEYRNIFEVNSNKPYAICLIFKETNQKYKELEKAIRYEKNIEDCHITEVSIIREISEAIKKYLIAVA